MCLTWADLAVFQFCRDGMGGCAPRDIKAACPNIANLCSRVAEIPNIKKWLANRPNTKM